MAVWRVQVRDQHERLHDVFIDAEAATRTETLIEQLDEAGFHAKPIGVHGYAINGRTSLDDLELTNGDVMTSGRLDPSESHPGIGRHLVALCGPDVGQMRQLPSNGSILIGRSGTCDLAIDDRLLSSEHCRVDLVDSVASVTDLRSTNGTYVEGVELTSTTELAPGSLFQVGSTVLTVADIRPQDLAVVGDPVGPERVFPRSYRTAQVPLPAKVDPPRPDSIDDESLNNVWWRALVPIIGGSGMALMTGRWQFLLIIAIAPLFMGYFALQRKRRKQRRIQQSEERYRQELAGFREHVTKLRWDERDRRRRTGHCGGASLLFARSWQRSLWERAPGDDDFLSVPVGLGSLPSQIKADDPDGALDEMLWGTPLETNLLRTGSLGIVGDLGRARCVARGIIMNLVATHSPSVLRVWILSSDEDGEQWGCARWLPHTFGGPQWSLIAVQPGDRALMLKQLKQLLDTRSEVMANAGDGRAQTPLPVNVVVIDGPELLEPGELTELLQRGPELGVAGITIDSRLAPEGLGATLRLSDIADQATFDSRHQPHTEGVIVPEVDAAAAERAARRLAPLRPSIDDDAAGVGGVCHLVEIESLAGTTAEQLVDRWQRMSPHMVATVGVASETTMHLDLVKDGPHGLIGGTSGSGKTEFLKTMFVSLCLNNHPDDLSIVVVDFKGGVDHDAIRPLPHVVDVATNLDIEQFERTIAMLNAEQKRRQALLAAAGATNVTSYRTVRAARPELPPLPRLLVVVDEFGELLAAEGGREKLKELESITRIGRALGLHLLLVTQNFEGSLPGQIDANAGLRISLRVQKPAHSKAVLDSGVAATIPDRRVGRGYARFHGRELIEFQTARVAGRRRDLEPESAAAEVRVVPFTSLATAPMERRSEDVPNEETDMFVLVERCREAARLSGWRRSAVPWPAALPDQVSMQALSRGFQGTGVPIGLMDVPDQQRRDTAYLTDRVQQLAVIGGSSAPVPEVLTTYGATLAMLSSPDDVHIYGIDLLGRSVSQLADLPHCGGVAVRNEQLALRIVRWMLQTASERKVAMASTGSSDLWEHAAATGELPPQVVLVVSGLDRMLNVTDGISQNLLSPLSTLVSEGLGVRFQVVLGGLPKVVHHRMGANIRHRLVLELADPTEYTSVGSHKSVASELRTPRRAVLLPDKRIVQLAQLAPAGTSEGAVIRRLAESLPPATVSPPKTFADVPWPVAWELAERYDRVAPPHFLAPLPVAIDLNDGGWGWIDAMDDGPMFAVCGTPKSGRSTMLAVLARNAAKQGWTVLNATTSRRSPISTSPDPVLANRCDPGELGEAVESIAGQLLVVVDDLHRLEDGSGIQAACTHPGRVLVAVACPPDLLGVRTGVMRGLPAVTAGVLLAPAASMDGAGLGLRRLPAEWTTGTRPGRGVLVLSGEPTEMQVPLVTFPPPGQAQPLRQARPANIEA